MAIFDVESQVVHQLPWQGERVIRPIAWSPDGKWLATARQNGHVQLWDAKTQSPVHLLDGHSAAVQILAWSADGEMLASADEDGKVHVWNAAEGRALPWRPLLDSTVRALAFSPDGAKLACGTDDTQGAGCRVWDIKSGKQLHEWESAAHLLAFSPDGKQLTAACQDNTLRRWDLASGKLLSERTSHPRHGEIVHWSLDQNQVVSLTDDKATAFLWNAETGAPLRAITVGCSEVVSISPDGHYHAPPGVEKELVYVALTESDEQITYTPDEFAKKYGWKNDPAKVGGRKSEVGGESKAESGKPKAEEKGKEKAKGEESRGEDGGYRPPVVGAELVKCFVQQDLYKAVTEIVDDRRSDFMQRLLYTEIATTLEREQRGTWRIGAGTTKDGQACIFTIRNAQWFVRKLSAEEAQKAGLEGDAWARSLDVIWKPPVNQIMTIEDARVRVETDARGRRAPGGAYQLPPRRTGASGLPVAGIHLPFAQEGRERN